MENLSNYRQMLCNTNLSCSMIISTNHALIDIFQLYGLQEAADTLMFKKINFPKCDISTSCQL